MRPLKRPQRYAIVKVFTWSGGYLKTKPRQMMPFEVRRALRLEQERQRQFLERTFAAMKSVVVVCEPQTCNDPECPTHHPKPAPGERLQ